MSFLEAIRLALAQIRAQKLKSFFTLLGVTIGVTFLIAIVSIVNGMGKYMEEDLVGKLIPKNSFEVRQRPNIQMGDMDESEWRELRMRPRLREEDVARVTADLPAGATWSVYSDRGVSVESRYARPTQVDLTAASNAWFDQKGFGLASGRLPTEQEFALGSPVVIIGKDVAEHFFPAVDAVGRELRIGSLPYEVIGVVEDQGNVMGMSLNKFAVTPFNSSSRRLLNPTNVVDGVIVSFPDALQMQAGLEDVRVTMRVIRGLRPSQKDDFSLQTADSALEFWRKIEGFLVIAGVALPAIGLIVGSIVIMNIMLVAVAERTREIGVRKALGAKRRDILSQFIVESTTLAILGAAIGILVGVGIAAAIKQFTPLPSSVELWSIILGVVVGGGVGIISGVYPASRAARLDPIAALRQE